MYLREPQTTCKCIKSTYLFKHESGPEKRGKNVTFYGEENTFLFYLGPHQCSGDEAISWAGPEVSQSLQFWSYAQLASLPWLVQIDSEAFNPLKCIALKQCCGAGAAEIIWGPGAENKFK